MPTVSGPAAARPTFFTVVPTVMGLPTTPRAGPDTATMARSGRMTSRRVGAVAPLFVSSDSVTTLSGSTTAETKYWPTTAVGGTVTTVVAGEAAPAASAETLREARRTPAPGTLLLADM